MSKLLALLATFLITSAAYAATPSDESIDTLLEATRAQKLVEGILVNVDQSMRQTMNAALNGQKISAQQQRALDRAAVKFADVLRDELSWAKMRPTYVQVYKESFSQEEIDGLIAFYQSPTGVAFVEKMPLVMQKTMAATQARMGPMMKKMTAAIQEAMAEIKASK